MLRQLLQTSAPALLLALTACAHQPVGNTPSPSGTPSEAPLQRNYSAASLADLLVAEVAAQRGAYHVTLGYYSQQARQHQDPLVAEQAAKLAAYLDDPVLATEMGEIWLKGSADPRDPRTLLALGYIEQEETAKAAAQIDILMEHAPRQALAKLITQARGLDEKSNVQLLSTLGSLTSHYPDQAPLWYAKALSLDIEQQPEQALAACEKAIKLDREHEDSRLLKARLLYRLEQQDKAITYLKKVVKRWPKAKRTRVLYTRLLIDNDRLAPVDKQLAHINSEYSDDIDTRLSLALLAINKGHRGEAIKTLHELLDQGHHTDEIPIFLAQAAEQDNEPLNALEYYMTAQGKNQLNAQIQAVRLMHSQNMSDKATAMMRQLREQNPAQLPALYIAEAEILSRSGDVPRAMTLLNEALQALPDNTDLLYARAMTAEQVDNLAQLEADLKRMIELDPEDSTALNALGYTLVNRTERTDEAAGYIEAAYKHRPDEPAIIDSMGWLRYRQGRPDEALIYLQQAWQLFPEQEIAAHLGEVLWVLGQQQEARRIWQAGLAQSPDSTAIPATVLRLTGSEKP